jgi:tRNA pseudouridine38-40 synthase
VRLLAIVEYDGTEFAGFQLQRRPRQAPAPRTVQAELERAIEAASGRPARVVGSGRTDAGVHALAQAAHFDTEAPLAADLPRFRRAINAHLPPDVSVHELRRVPPEFHARFSARSRTYVYRILNGETPSPLLRRYTHHVRQPLDVGRMAEAARALVGSYDFTAFAAQEEGRGARRDVYRAVVAVVWPERAMIWHTESREPGADLMAPEARGVARAPAWRVVEIEVEANAFVRHMMRRIAGTLIRVGLGRLAPGEVAAIIASREKARAGPTAPARGLCLKQVSY